MAPSKGERTTTFTKTQANITSDTAKSSLAVSSYFPSPPTLPASPVGLPSDLVISDTVSVSKHLPNSSAFSIGKGRAVASRCDSVSNRGLCSGVSNGEALAPSCILDVVSMELTCQTATIPSLQREEVEEEKEEEEEEEEEKEGKKEEGKENEEEDEDEEEEEKTVQLFKKVPFKMHCILNI